MIGFCSSPRLAEHRTSAHHPERPDRIRAIHRAVRAAGMIASPDPFPDFKLELGASDGSGVKLLELAPEPADEKSLLAVHPREHIHRVKRICELGGGVLDSGDTPVGQESCDIAMLSVGALLKS